MKKSLLMTFIFACCPGAGQMYLRYMKRGLSLMFLFFGLTVFTALGRMPAIAFVIPIIWFYSFFDTFHIRNASAEELEQMQDSLIFNLDNSEVAKKYFGKRNIFLGIVLVAIGLYIFSISFLPESISYIVQRYFPILAVAAILVIAGLKLMVGDRDE